MPTVWNPRRLYSKHGKPFARFTIWFGSRYGNYFFSLPVSDQSNPVLGIERVIVPFLACGDLSAFDSDMTYPLEVKRRITRDISKIQQLNGEKYEWRPPVHPPIQAPYIDPSTSQ